MLDLSGEFEISADLVLLAHCTPVVVAVFSWGLFSLVVFYNRLLT